MEGIFEHWVEEVRFRKAVFKRGMGAVFLTLQTYFGGHFQALGRRGAVSDSKGDSDLTSENILKVVSERIPEGVHYRRTAEGIFKHWIEEVRFDARN